MEVFVVLDIIIVNVCAAAPPPLWPPLDDT